MKSFAIVAGLTTGVAASQCSPGYKQKKVLTGLTCDTADANSAKDCNTNCCEPDTNTCGGLTPSCAADSYAKAAKSTQAQQDAWAATAATSKDMNTVCCTKKALCSSGGFTCPASKKLTTVAGPLGLGAACPDDAASCATSSACCMVDDKTCGGKNFAIGGCTKADGYIAPYTGTAPDSWKGAPIKDATTLATQAQSCCAVAPTCASKLYSCPAGKKKTTDAKKLAEACSGADPTSCATTPDCCENDLKTCKGLAVRPTCTAGWLDPALDNTPATAATGAQNCCSAVATCAVATCPSGKKKKANVDATKCPTDAASCTGTTCCEDDKTTCGGIKATTGLTCAVGFYDASTVFAKAKYTAALQLQQDSWNNKKTTEATKNTDCCTAKAVCQATGTLRPGVTSTPPPAVPTIFPTATPAAPARLFSQHKAAVQATSSATSNIVWCMVGSAAGMSILYMVQRLRNGNSYASVEDGFESEQ